MSKVEGLGFKVQLQWILYLSWDGFREPPWNLPWVLWEWFTDGNERATENNSKKQIACQQIEDFGCRSTLLVADGCMPFNLGKEEHDDWHNV